MAGKWDGVGAVLKRKLRQEQLHNPKRRLQHAKKVVSFLDEVLSTQVPTSYTQNKPNILRKFWHIAIDDIDRSNPFGCGIIPKS